MLHAQYVALHINLSRENIVTSLKQWNIHIHQQIGDFLFQGHVLDIKRSITYQGLDWGYIVYSLDIHILGRY